MRIIDIYDCRHLGGAYESNEAGYGILCGNKITWVSNEARSEVGQKPRIQIRIHGILDSDFAKDPETCKIVSCIIMFLCGAHVIQRSTLHIIVALSVT
jgi:hypothetical protein